MTKSLFIVVGSALLLVGAGLYLTSRPLSENDAIQQAARTTIGDNGQRMYTITDGEIRGALQRRQSTNASRESKQQVGAALAIPGVILLAIGLAGTLAANKAGRLGGLRA